jgi:opacity protein-like surface antigen
MRRAVQRMLLTDTVAATMSLAWTVASAQFYKPHGADIGIAAAGQFTTSLTDQDISSTGELLPHQSTTNSPGVLLTLRDHPVSWAGVEFNYQYTKFQQRYYSAYTSAPTAFLPTNLHEATAAYLFRVHMKRLSPYVGIGGGALDFSLTNGLNNSNNQWRGTGLVDLGFDMQTHSRLGFRLGARDLMYRAPDYQNAGCRRRAGSRPRSRMEGFI